MARGGWKEGKLKRAGNAGKGKERKEGFSLLPSFPALPLPFVSLVFTNRSLCRGESSQKQIVLGSSLFCSYCFSVCAPNKQC